MKNGWTFKKIQNFRFKSFFGKHFLIKLFPFSIEIPGNKLVFSDEANVR